MISLQSLIASIMSKKYSAPKWHAVLLSSWQEIAGMLASKMYIKKIEESVLFVGVYDARWMHELYMLNSVIIQSLNEKLGDVYITDIKFSLSANQQTKKVKKRVIVENNSPLLEKKHTLSVKQSQALLKITDNVTRNNLYILFQRQKV